MEPDEMSKDELLKRVRQIWNEQNQSETDAEWQKLEDEFLPLNAEMEKRGLTANDVPAWDQI